MTSVTGRRRGNLWRDIFFSPAQDPEAMAAADLSELHESEIDPDPLVQFRRWFDQALAANLPQPEAVTLATATPTGAPSARMVLLRGFDEAGFVFFTNYQSRKARELQANPRAALVFFWAELHRQVRVEGQVEMVSAAESDAYFRTRPRGSQLGAWVSPQSQVIPDRAFLDERWNELIARFPADVPRPDFWGGFRVIPEQIEFWQGRENRLHDRLLYRRSPAGWTMVRLAP
jgi:pyridoxamine 5'-phosphate oxidase